MDSVDIVLSLLPCSSLSGMGKKNPHKLKYFGMVFEAFTRGNSKQLIIETHNNILGDAYREFLKNLYDKYLRDEYTLLCYQTNAIDYGIPQHRDRVYLIITKGNKYPQLFNPQKRKSLIDFLGDINPEPGDICNISLKLSEEIRAWVDFTKNNYNKNWENIPTKFQGLPIRTIIKKGLYDESTVTKPIEKAIFKMINGIPFFNRSPLLARETTGLIIYKTLIRTLLPPDYTRHLTIREAMSLMGFPITYYYKNPRANFKNLYRGLVIPVATEILQQLKRAQYKDIKNSPILYHFNPPGGESTIIDYKGNDLSYQFGGFE
jgi:site-specific DNA-cytosine methylase